MTSSFLIRNILNKNKSIFTASIAFISSNKSFNDLKIHSEDAQLTYKRKLSREELENRLTSLQFYVTQLKGTERPFGDSFKQKETGEFACVVCDQDIFSSKTKFESYSGWPSFYDVINSDRVNLIEDSSHGMKRIECVCSGCGAHLGHLFNDGPEPTHLRYCINAASLNFKPEKS